MLRKFIRESVIPCLRNAGVNYLVSGSTVFLSATDMEQLRLLDPEVRWPLGDLVLCGERTVFASHTGENVVAIVGKVVPVQNSNTRMVAVSFSLKKEKR
ncbi:hypothetical protein J7K92_02450 [bacterium]|nr:hypothetical protein [bacterium]